MRRKNITFRAEEVLIEAARERARDDGRSLNAAVRRWLEEYADRSGEAREAMELIESMRRYASTEGRKLTREELNERPGRHGR